MRKKKKTISSMYIIVILQIILRWCSRAPSYSTCNQQTLYRYCGKASSSRDKHISSRIASRHSEIRSDPIRSKRLVNRWRRAVITFQAFRERIPREERIPECVIEELARFRRRAYHRSEINDGKPPGTTTVLSLSRSRVGKLKEFTVADQRSRDRATRERRGAR